MTYIDRVARDVKNGEAVTVHVTKSGKVWARTPKHLGGSGKPYLLGRTKAGNVFCACEGWKWSDEHEVNRSCKHAMKAVMSGKV